MTPGSAPSTAASQEPSFGLGFPFSYSVVSSPKYQRLPSESWARRRRRAGDEDEKGARVLLRAPAGGVLRLTGPE
jgi:hypothetical protein